MATDRDPIKEQLIEARRNQILDAAAAVFAQKGFHRATTKDIASTAGVSEGTIYNYFANKADLLIGIMTRVAELTQLSAELPESLQTDTKEFFTNIFRSRLGLFQQNQEIIHAVLPEVLVNSDIREQFYEQFVLRIADLLEQYVEWRIELGHIRPVDVPLAVRALQSMFIGLLVMRILGDDIVLSRWDDVPETAASLIFDGLKPRDEE